tara:strand:- start:173 stop:667 length:495 start_codon:yes stop_codon:yes gene_type:complete
MIFFLIVSIFISRAPFAAPKELYVGETWSAWVIKSKKRLMCYVHAEPKKKTGKYRHRGDTYLQVTNRPYEKVRDEVSVTAGYVYKRNSSVVAEVDGQKRRLFTSGGAAWSQNKRDDQILVKKMLRGRELVIKGVSSRGTLTTDYYSLIGFTLAYRAAEKACGVK